LKDVAELSRVRFVMKGGSLMFRHSAARARTSLALLFGAVGPPWGSSLHPARGVAVLAARSSSSAAKQARADDVGAHPDDEYSDLVALFARGMGAQVAYSVAQPRRGRAESSSVPSSARARHHPSEELLAARRIDGAASSLRARTTSGIPRRSTRRCASGPRLVLRDVLEGRAPVPPPDHRGPFSRGRRVTATASIRWPPRRAQAFEVLRDSSWGPVKLYRSLYA